MAAPSLTLSASPGTDVWRKPPSTDVFNAPTHYSSPPFPLSSLRSARVSFAATWVHQYDQAGLLLSLTPKGTPAPRKWVKTGIEFFDGQPRLSTVACDTWADWSLAPVEEGEGRITVVVERHAAEDGGASLLVSRLRGDTKEPLREVCWAFADEEGWEVQVGAYACRPGKEGGQLEVAFWNLEVESV